MLKTCAYCGEIFSTEYPTKIFCNKNCASKAARTRDESYYEFPHEPNQEPIYTFECAYCGKLVQVYSRYDQRTRFCCGLHAAKFQIRIAKIRQSKHRPTNNGLSGGMSLGSLIRREARALKD